MEKCLHTQKENNWMENLAQGQLIKGIALQSLLIKFNINTVCGSIDNHIMNEDNLSSTN